jgi:putative phage-type endonuclease
MSGPEYVADPQTDEWMAARSAGIGASEAAAACGLSAYQTPLELYLRKRGEMPAFEGNDATVRGTRFEPVILQYAEEVLDKKLKPGWPPMMRHGEHSWMFATPDGDFEDGELLECKSSVSPKVLAQCGEEGSDEVPTEYLLQCQQQMAVMDRQVVHLQLVIPSRWKFFEFRNFIVNRNDRLIASLIKKERELWQMIEAGVPPEPDWQHASTMDLIRNIHGAPEAEAEFVELSDAAVEQWARYESIKSQIKELNAQATEARARVVHEIADNAGGILPEGRAVRRKLIQKKGHVVQASEYVDIRAIKF